MRKLTFWVLFLACSAATAHAQAAQTPAAPPPVWTGNFGGGLALTEGNSDTKNFNVSFNLVRDPKQRNVIKWTALYLRGTKQEDVIIDRATVGLRDEFTLSPRVFLFGQLDYLRDRFKDIIFLWSPTAGIGYKFINTDTAILTLDTGLGGIWEKNPGRDTQSSGAYNAGERLAWKLSRTATVTQSLTGLWKTKDWADALYNLGLGIAASVTSNSELKFEVLNVYKNKPASATIKKNDVAIVTAFVVKF